MQRRSLNSETYPLLGGKMEKLSMVTKISYGFGHIFNDLCAAMWFSYTLFYMQIILQIEASTAGILLMIGQVADALATPLAGWAIDRFGYRKRWHFVGTVMVSMSFPMVFTVCQICGDNFTATLSYYVTSIVIFQIGWATVQISHLSIIPSITLNDNYRSELTAIRYTGAVCSSVVVYVITWIVLDTTSADSRSIGPEDFAKFRIIIFIICGIGLTATIIFYVGVRGKEDSKKDVSVDLQVTTVKPITNDTPSVITNGTNSNGTNQMAPSYDKSSKLLTTAQIFMSPIVYQVSLLYVASRLYMILNLVYMPLYLDERDTFSLNEDLRESIATVPLLSYLASFLASLGLKYKDRFFSNKMAYFIGSTLSITSCIWIGLLDTESKIENIYFIAIFIGTGSSTTMVASLCLTAEMIGKNTEKGGSVYSVVTFTDKLICGIAVVIVEHLKCENKSECPEYYKYVLALVSGGAVILGIVILSTLMFSKAQTIKSDKDSSI